LGRRARSLLRRSRWLLKTKGGLLGMADDRDEEKK
jgi:hypothetical protein